MYKYLLVHNNGYGIVPLLYFKDLSFYKALLVLLKEFDPEEVHDTAFKFGNITKTLTIVDWDQLSANKVDKVMKLLEQFNGSVNLEASQVYGSKEHISKFYEQMEAQYLEVIDLEYSIEIGETAYYVDLNI